jgi:hypothetical protein
MAKPINHDMVSEVTTTGWEGAKGAAKGALAIPAAGALAGAVVGLLGAALFASGIGAALAVVAVGATVGAVGAGVVGAPAMGIFAAIGAALGLNSASDKISKEKIAFREKIQEQEGGKAGQMAAAQNQGLQQGYQVGFQEGQAYAVNRIQQEIQAQAAGEQQEQAPAQKTIAGVPVVEGDNVRRYKESMGPQTRQVGG